MANYIPGEKVDETIAGLKEAVIPPAAPKPDPAIVASATEDNIKIIEDLTEDKIFECDLIEARPLGYGSLLDVKPIHKEYAYRWINRFNRQRFLEAKAMGFLLATEEDVEVVPEMLQDGAIQVGDLILMKMQKMRYFGHLKHKDMKALQSGSKQVLNEKGMAEGNKTISKLGNAEDIRRKVSVYVPPIGELDGKIK